MTHANAMIGAKPYGQLQYRDVHGKRMAYVDEGDGEAIVRSEDKPHRATRSVT